MNRKPAVRRQWIRTIRSALQVAALCALAGGTFWNLLAFQARALEWPERRADEIVVQEERYKPIRQLLIRAGYLKGPIAFITNRDLKGIEKTPDDDKRAGQGQYVMVPWTLLRNGRAVAGRSWEGDAPLYAIGDFWDGRPEQFPDDLIQLYESESGLVLFQRKPPR